MEQEPRPQPATINEDGVLLISSVVLNRRILDQIAHRPAIKGFQMDWEDLGGKDLRAGLLGYCHFMQQGQGTVYFIGQDPDGRLFKVRWIYMLEYLRRVDNGRDDPHRLMAKLPQIFLKG